MNKCQLICPLVAGLVASIVYGLLHLPGERRYLTDAVTRQLDSHAAPIAKLLVGMSHTNLSLMEDAVFEELKTGNSMSLIVRSMIRVVDLGNGRLECVVDTSTLGVPARTNRLAR